MRRDRGFTLIEVVVAFAILGLSLSVLYGTFSNSIARTRQDASLSEATLLAQSLLNRAAAETTEFTEGEWSDFHYQLTRQLIAAPVKQSAFTIPTERVTARVRWVGGHGPREIELSTLRLVHRVSP